jgi:phenylpyruvate tautomerase PptA (4-oxalocrotonate tautomerase family)
MPLVSINLRKGRPPKVKRAIADAVHAALVANLGIPETDRFQLIREYESADFIHSDAHLDLTYTPDLIMLEIRRRVRHLPRRRSRECLLRQGHCPESALRSNDDRRCAAPRPLRS